MKILKTFLFVFFILTQIDAQGQNIQLHYDLRHAFDPETAPRNFPSLSFEYFKKTDSLGSFLFKFQSDMQGESSNVSQTFLQVSQTLKFWSPELYLSINYSGGLGIAPPSYGFYISNAFGLGVAYPFQWNEAFLNLNVQYRYTTFKAPSHDVQATFYFGKGFFNYKLFIQGSMVAWTENRNQGTEHTSAETGKKIAFFGDPQIWFRIRGGFSVGSRINLLYNLIESKKELKVYPTVGTQYKF